MKKVLLLSILFPILISCNKSHLVPFLKFEGMHGKVQAYKESIYDTVEKFGEIMPEKLSFVRVCDFDKEGHKVKEFSYDEYGQPTIGFEYTIKDHVVIVSKTYNWDNKEPDVIDEQLSSNGKCRIYKYTSKDTTYIYSINTFALDKLYFKSIYSNSDLVVESRFDKKGNLLEQKATSGEKIVEWYIWRHNKDNLLIEVEDRVNQSNSTFKYTEFDERGNWISAIQYCGEEIFFLQREIKYW